MDLPSVSVEFKVVLAIVDSFEGLDDLGSLEVSLTGVGQHANALYVRGEAPGLNAFRQHF